MPATPNEHHGGTVPPGYDPTDATEIPIPGGTDPKDGPSCSVTSPRGSSLAKSGGTRPPAATPSTCIRRGRPPRRARGDAAMLWRVVLFLGAVVVVVMLAASVALDGETNTTTHRSCGQYAPDTFDTNGNPIQGKCEFYSRDVIYAYPGRTGAYDLRLGAGGVAILTVASLPMLAGIGRRRRAEGASGAESGSGL